MADRLTLVAVAAGVLLAATGNALAASCEKLIGMKVTGGEVVAATAVEAGKPPTTERLTIADYSPMPAHCRVTAAVTSGPGSSIRVEIWLPQPEAWTRKFLGTGNGGFGGALPIDWLATGVRLGYATANTDMGTAGAGGYDGGIGKPEMIKDWGWRSTHAMTVVGKEITKAYFDSNPQMALFAGCSTGGHQGLMEAQRFPADYDGILAGDAGNYRIGLHAAFLYYRRLAIEKPDYWISPEQAVLIKHRIVARCAGQGSGLATDEFVANPASCHFNLETLLCATGRDAKACLTAPQIAMLRQIHSGVRNPRTGALIYPGTALGGESGVIARLGPEGAPVTGSFSLINWSKGAAFDPAKFDFDQDVGQLFRDWGADINAVSADLSAFKRRGGKLITFHGWEDTTVSPYDSIDYYERLRDRRSFSRLFMVPGMGHCFGGTGFSSFGARTVPGGIDDAQHNLILALDRWVTSGRAPEQVIATKWSGLSGPTAPGQTSPPPASPPLVLIGTRPLCAYPKVARYNGTGETARAENFTCVAGPAAKYARPSPEYLVNAGAFRR